MKREALFVEISCGDGLLPGLALEYGEGGLHGSLPRRVAGPTRPPGIPGLK